ncbi:cytokine-dependent hematopoietic cell linker [Synchiropus picturatus]
MSLKVALVSDETGLCSTGSSFFIISQCFPKVPSNSWNNLSDPASDEPMKEPQQSYSAVECYVGVCGRIEAEHALHLVNKDGAFLIRDCSANTDSEPLVLAVYHDKRVYNVKIRFIESTRKYALGTGQRSNDMFDSVEDIVRFYSSFPIMLVSARHPPGSSFSEQCVLRIPVTRQHVKRLLA